MSSKGYDICISFNFMQFVSRRNFSSSTGISFNLTKKHNIEDGPQITVAAMCQALFRDSLQFSQKPHKRDTVRRADL